MPGMAAAAVIPASPAAPSPSLLPAAPPASATEAGVSIAGFAFAPATLTVSEGQTITWTNNDSVSHTVTSDSGLWDSKPLQPGATFGRTFDQPGTYTYHCSIHPFMQAQVVVTP